MASKTARGWCFGTHSLARQVTAQEKQKPTAMERRVLIKVMR